MIRRPPTSTLFPTRRSSDLVARMIHELSRRGTNKFQALNCAALPDTLFESEIFGYEKGAFTGAHDRKPGDRKSTRLNSSHSQISYAVFCLKKKKKNKSLPAP